MIIVLFVFGYLIIASIFIGILNGVDNYEQEEAILFGLIWPILIILTIFVSVIETSEKITKKVLKKWN